MLPYNEVILYTFDLKNAKRFFYFNCLLENLHETISETIVEVLSNKMNSTIDIIPLVGDKTLFTFLRYISKLSNKHRVVLYKHNLMPFLNILPVLATVYVLEEPSNN